MRQRSSKSEPGDARQRPTLLGVARRPCEVENGIAAKTNSTATPFLRYCRQGMCPTGTFYAESQFGDVAGNSVVNVGYGHGCSLEVKSGRLSLPKLVMKISGDGESRHCNASEFGSELPENMLAVRFTSKTHVSRNVVLIHFSFSCIRWSKARPNDYVLRAGAIDAQNEPRGVSCR